MLKIAHDKCQWTWTKVPSSQLKCLVMVFASSPQILAYLKITPVLVSLTQAISARLEHLDMLNI